MHRLLELLLHISDLDFVPYYILFLKKLTPKLKKHLSMLQMFRAFVKLQQADGSFSMTGSRKVKENFYMRFGEEKLGPASNNQMHQTKQHSKTLMKIKGPHQSHHLLVTLPLWMKTSDSRRRMGC